MLKPKVLVVEDESAIAELLLLNLRHNGFEPIWARDGSMAQAEVDNVLPDIVLLDLMLPGISGLELAQRWRNTERCKNLPIVIITAKDDDKDIVSGLETGADDYITKPFSVTELVARMRAVLRRRLPERFLQVLEYGVFKLDPGTFRFWANQQELRLSATEFKIMQYFMNYPDQVHSRSQLLDKVWGDHVFIEERTVDVHIKRLRQTLGSTSGWIETVRGVGYRLRAVA